MKKYKIYRSYDKIKRQLNIIERSIVIYENYDNL